MAFGNNRVGSQTRASFQQAGGTVMKLRHPYLTGAIKTSTGAITDILDISACVKLDETFFKAEPNQDSSSQVVMVNGDTVVVTNSMLNGTITIPLVETTGLVGDGDAVAALHLIKSVGDSVGGMLYRTRFINGKAITRLYYGISIKRLPDDVINGLNVPTYSAELFYAGWIESVNVSTTVNLKAIWAVGNDEGISGYFDPYDINADAESGSESLTASAAQSGDSSLTDDTTADNNIDNLSSDTDTSTAPTNTTLEKDYILLSAGD